MTMANQDKTSIEQLDNKAPDFFTRRTKDQNSHFIRFIAEQYPQVLKNSDFRSMYLMYLADTQIHADLKVGKSGQYASFSAFFQEHRDPDALIPEQMKNYKNPFMDRRLQSSENVIATFGGYDYADIYGMEHADETKILPVDRKDYLSATLYAPPHDHEGDLPAALQDASVSGIYAHYNDLLYRASMSEDDPALLKEAFQAGEDILNGYYRMGDQKVFFQQLLKKYRNDIIRKGEKGRKRMIHRLSELRAQRRELCIQQVSGDTPDNERSVTARLLLSEELKIRRYLFNHDALSVKTTLENLFYLVFSTKSIILAGLYAKETGDENAKKEYLRCVMVRLQMKTKAYRKEEVTGMFPFGKKNQPPVRMMDIMLYDPIAGMKQFYDYDELNRLSEQEVMHEIERLVADHVKACEACINERIEGLKKEFSTLSDEQSDFLFRDGRSGPESLCLNDFLPQKADDESDLPLYDALHCDDDYYEMWGKSLVASGEKVTDSLLPRGTYMDFIWNMPENIRTKGQFAKILYRPDAERYFAESFVEYIRHDGQAFDHTRNKDMEKNTSAREFLNSMIVLDEEDEEYEFLLDLFPGDMDFRKMKEIAETTEYRMVVYQLLCDIRRFVSEMNICRLFSTLANQLVDNQFEQSNSGQ